MSEFMIVLMLLFITFIASIGADYQSEAIELRAKLKQCQEADHER